MCTNFCCRVCVIDSSTIFIDIDKLRFIENFPPLLFFCVCFMFLSAVVGELENVVDISTPVADLGIRSFERSGEGARGPARFFSQHFTTVSGFTILPQNVTRNYCADVCPQGFVFPGI